MDVNRRHAPATARNREPILAVLRDTLPASGVVLEVASGTGEHAVFFARALPHLAWQPTDVGDDALESIRAWRAAEPSPNLWPPLRLDASEGTWPLDRADAIVCINMIHIAPDAARHGLFAGAAKRVPEAGPLVLYGPFMRGGAHTAESNAAFDRDLRARDPRWGVRDLDAVHDEARSLGFSLDRVVEMPANNLVVVFRLQRRG